MTCPMAAANADWAADLARQGLKQAKEVDPKELFANMTRLAQNLPDEGGDDTWVALLAGPLQRDNGSAGSRAGEVLRHEAAGTEKKKGRHSIMSRPAKQVYHSTACEVLLQLVFSIDKPQEPA
ncbi:hypothetical protein DIPPA_09591 [Diplonema papillatum]|nr:hypothetical protein DIPPA_09591 [Diplonema papillatum]